MKIKIKINKLPKRKTASNTIEGNFNFYLHFH